MIVQATTGLSDQEIEAQPPPLGEVVVVIPAYNEGRFIGSTVINARSQAGRVIVVDDGSQDETAWIARQVGATVIRHPANLGKGAALNSGLRAARIFEPRAVVLLDADGQHCPQEMARLLEPIFQNQADLVIGSRYLLRKNCVPAARLLGHRLFNLLTRLASGEHVTDSQCGFRAISGNVLASIRFNSNGFSVESEMQFLASDLGLRLREVGVTVLYPDKPRRPLLVHGLMVLGGLLRLTGQYRPLLSFGLPGCALFLGGLAFSIYLLMIYSAAFQPVVVIAVAGIVLALAGLLLWLVGFTLHSLRAMLREILKNLKP